MPVRPRVTIGTLLAVVAWTAIGAVDARAATPVRLGQRAAITATLDVAEGHLDAELVLELTNRGDAPLEHVDLSAVPRALGFFTLGSPVTVDGQPVEPAWTTTINLRVPLASFDPAETVEVRLPFTLDVGLAPDAFRARTSADRGVLTFGQWWPLPSIEHDVYGLGDPQISFTADAITLDLTTTAPLPRDAIACPGLVEAPARSGTRWRCETSDVRDFSFVVNPRFVLRETTVDGTLVRVYAETVDGSPTLALAVDALRGLEDRFGPYPWEDLVLAEVGSAGGFSMEYPRMIHLTRDKVADPYVVLHEVAHQWFYGLVGNDQQAEPWLDEAWADWSARDLMGIGENQCSGRPVDSPVFAWPAGATTGGDWTSCDGYFHAVFYRGTELISSIRSAMGDEAFFGAMRQWFERRRFGFASEGELLGHLQAASAADLRPVLDTYLAGYELVPPKPIAVLRRG
jgi:Peptidase family M1 domain